MPESEVHKILGDKVNIYKRENSSHWQCATYLGGRNHRKSTKEESLARAKEIAEDWYLELRGKFRSGELGKEEARKKGKLFTDAADQFLTEFEQLTQGQRSPHYIFGIKRRLEKCLKPFFGHLGVNEITAGTVSDYRVHRTKQAMEKHGQPPARNTMHQEIVTLRQVMKTALRHGWIDHLPDMTAPYGASGKVSHRAWFSPEEYKQLYTATRKRAHEPKLPRYKWESEQLHDYVLFMVNTGLRPDEAKRLQFRDVSIVEDDATDETILEIEVRGKRGVGYCKSTSGAVRPFERLKARKRPPHATGNGRKSVNPDGPSDQPDAWKVPDATDLVFPKFHRELLKTILDEEKLRADRDGRPRTAYSLRHTYICLRLMEGADIYQIAKNCRTSVEMIEKFYAAHIKTNLDAAAINIRRQKPKKSGKKKASPPPEED
jgi:integrase